MGKIENPAADKMCRDSQQTPVYTPGFPMLKAAPGSLVRVAHNENGHTSKPTRRPEWSLATPDGEIIQVTGDIEYYTLTPEIATMTLQQFRSNKPKLLTKQAYDDGICTEPSSGQGTDTKINHERHAAAGLNENLTIECGTHIQIPPDAKPGQVLSFLWVWDFSGKNGIIPGVTEVRILPLFLSSSSLLTSLS